ncbi:MAG TPA: hypothetical protein VK362_22980 [Reyranella sp.]|nr:hypothetical protein [Reyranella sp.]
MNAAAFGQKLRRRHLVVVHQGIDLLFHQGVGIPLDRGLLDLAAVELVGGHEGAQLLVGDAARHQPQRLAVEVTRMGDAVLGAGEDHRRRLLVVDGEALDRLAPGPADRRGDAARRADPILLALADQRRRAERALRFGERHLQAAALEGAHLAREIEAGVGRQRLPVEEDLDPLELVFGLGARRGHGREEGGRSERCRHEGTTLKGHACIMARDYLGRNRQPVGFALFFSRRNA